MVKLSSLSTTPCNFIPSGVTTVAVSYSCEKSFIGSGSPVASRLLGLRTDSARYSRDRDVPVELRSGPRRPPLPLSMWQVLPAALQTQAKKRRPAELVIPPAPPLSRPPRMDFSLARELWGPWPRGILSRQILPQSPSASSAQAKTSKRFHISIHSCFW